MEQKRTFVAIETTYYLVTATGVVVRGTTARAQKKLKRLVEINPAALRPLAPKKAKQLVAASREYLKIKDIL